MPLAWPLRPTDGHFGEIVDRFGERRDGCQHGAVLMHWAGTCTAPQQQGLARDLGPALLNKDPAVGLVHDDLQAAHVPESVESKEM